MSWRDISIVDVLAEIWEVHKRLGHVPSHYVCPTINVRRSQTKEHTTAHAYPPRRHIVMTIGTAATAGVVLGTLVHEVCHFNDDDVKGLGHGEMFWSRVDAITLELWGTSSGSLWRGGYKRQRAVDIAIDKALANRRIEEL